MKDWDTAFVEQLLDAGSYREFIKLFFHRDKGIEKPKRLTFGEFALRSNFASKAYLNDIIAGRKRLTPGSFDKVASGLRLNSLWAKYLKNLAASEEPKFHSGGKDQKHYSNQCLKIKDQIPRSRSVRALLKPQLEIQRIFLRPDFPEIYASLGDLETGESFERIAQKSNLPPQQLKSALADLEAIGLVHHNLSTKRYVPLALNVEAYGLKNEEAFRSDFFRSLEKAKKRFAKQSPSESALFMTQSVSVRSDQLAPLRKQLAEIIENFAVQAEDADGDCVGEVCISWTHNQ